MATARSAFRSAASRSPSRRRTGSRSTSSTRPATSGSRSTARARPIRCATFASSGPAPRRRTPTSRSARVFLEKIAPFSLLRFMDWGATNGSPVVEWADRAHVADVTYATRGRRADRSDDRARQHAARRSLVLHPASGERRLRAPVRNLVAQPVWILRCTPTSSIRTRSGTRHSPRPPGPMRARRRSVCRARSASRRSSTRRARCRSSRSSRACWARPRAAASCASSPARRCGTTSSATCWPTRTPPPTPT